MNWLPFRGELQACLQQGLDTSIQFLGFSVGFWFITQAVFPSGTSLLHTPQCPAIQIEMVPASASHPICSSGKQWGLPCWKGK